VARHGAPELTNAQTDRAAGVLLAQACGDALGVPYEFAALPQGGEQPRMIGGGPGPYRPGEYSDDTQLAACVAQVAETGADLTDETALDEIARRFLGWLAGGAGHVGVQTRTVLARTDPDKPAASMREAARELHAETGRGAGNGALMRTAPVALAHLDEPEVMAEAARAVAELTHADPLAGDACVLWCTGIATAVREGTFDGIRAGLDLIAAPSRDRWAQWLTEAEQSPPERFNPNGFTVPALQAAYAAVRRTPVPPDDPAHGSFPCLHLQQALAAAVRAGDDTDTVAAIAGALLGARWGASAVPFGWRRVVHGWPGLRARDLVSLGVLSARAGEPDGQGWPQCARMPYDDSPHPAVAHPHDDGVLLGGAGTVSDATAVVSLCRRGRNEAPASGVAAADHVEVRLQDKTDPAENPNLEFVIDDAARAVAALRDEGQRVLLHCVHGLSRTPTVATRYAALRGAPVPDALAAVVAAIPGACPNPTLRAALDRLGGNPNRRRARGGQPEDCAD
jgi:ADP-ribosylglycohydrolase/predicted protein tyrosine phosphatase